MQESHAEFERIKNPYVPKMQKIASKIHNILLPLYLLSYRKYEKFFNLIEEINPEKPTFKPLTEILNKVENSELQENDKKLLKELFKKEYEVLEKGGLKRWIENSPAILPEKNVKIEKLVNSLYKF